MSMRVHDITRMGTNTPDLVNSSIVAALIKLENSLPRPFENGVALSPITLDFVVLINSTHAAY